MSKIASLLTITRKMPPEDGPKVSKTYRQSATTPISSALTSCTAHMLKVYCSCHQLVSSRPMSLVLPADQPPRTTQTSESTEKLPAVQVSNLSAVAAGKLAEANLEIEKDPLWVMQNYDMDVEVEVVESMKFVESVEIVASVWRRHSERMSRVFQLIAPSTPTRVASNNPTAVRPACAQRSCVNTCQR